jgi:Protein of unknown function (DUF3108)
MMRKTIGFFVLAIIGIIFIGQNELTAQKANFFQPGEELHYDVSFMGIKLGSIKVFSKEKTTLDGNKVYNVKCTMDTYSGIPFVDLHAIFEGWADKSFSYSRKFVSRTKESDTAWSYQQILYDYEEGEIERKKWLNKTLVDSTHIDTKRKWNDGISLFFLARKYAKREKSYRIPTMIEQDTCFTTINFRNKIEEVEIDAVDYPISTVYFDGLADWTGVYGVSGEFQGWFSNDEASVPILAKMKVMVGSVDITLVKWKRKDWTPPKK